jgi:signal transduction histidine kinase
MAGESVADKSFDDAGAHARPVRPASIGHRIVLQPGGVMLPQAVLHKRNGNRHVPETPARSPGDVLRVVHSDGGGSIRPSYDLLRFAHAAQREKDSALLAQVAQDVDAMRTALAAVVAETQEALQRGEYPDVGGLLAAIAAQAEIALRIISRLAEAARPREGERRPISVHQLALDALARAVGRLHGGIAVSTRIAPDLPPIEGDDELLAEALVALVVHAEAELIAARRGGTISIDIAWQAAGGSAPARVLIRVAGESAALAGGSPRVPEPAGSAEADAGDLALGRARQIVLDHGGAMSAERRGGTLSVTVELPAS